MYHRVMISISTEVKNEIEAIKRNSFYDKPYSELYRQLIQLGLVAFRESNPSGSPECENKP